MFVGIVILSVTGNTFGIMQLFIDTIITITSLLVKNIRH